MTPFDGQAHDGVECDLLWLRSHDTTKLFPPTGFQGAS